MSAGALSGLTSAVNTPGINGEVPDRFYEASGTTIRPWLLDKKTVGRSNFEFPDKPAGLSGTTVMSTRRGNLEVPDQLWRAVRDDERGWTLV